MPKLQDAVTIDRIAEAFHVLSSPSGKAEYDKSLLVLHRSEPQRESNQQQQQQQQQDNFQTGIETVDLDDLDYDEDQLCWHRACRCGHDRGFFLGEDDLDEASDHGEVVVGCSGCSLWIKVHFAVVD